MTSRILRERDVVKKTGKSRVAIWNAVRKGTFPVPLKIGPNRKGWFEDEIDAWLARRATAEHMEA